MLSSLKTNRARIAYLHDLIMAAASFPLALYLRVGDHFSNIAGDYVVPAAAAFSAIAAILFRYGRLYRGIWAYASIDDLFAITKTVTLAILIFIPILFFMTRLELVPRSAPLIHWALLIGMLGGPRFAYRIFKDRRTSRKAESSLSQGVPVLLIGAGDAAELFLRDLRRDMNAAYQPVGIIDHKGGRVGREIHGVEILGLIDDVESLLTKDRFTRSPQRLIITEERIDSAVIRSLFDLAADRGISIGRLPRLSELQDAEGASVRTRPVAVEDLLGRPQTPMDRAPVKALIQGKRVLITGAGGSIGSELARQTADLAPASLILVDHSEFHLYEIDRTLAEQHSTLTREMELADIRDKTRIADIFARTRPDIVFHAAALKHVPIVESNPMEGVLTNAIGSRTIADACAAAGVDRMVMISTDKSVNPTNIMGATKRLAETYIQALDRHQIAEGFATGSDRGLDTVKKQKTRFSAVRFGNVLGSTGSVVPLFEKQIARGGPVTVTHPDMTRYFMTVREAVELVLQAAALDDRVGGPNQTVTMGRVFILDMGAPVRILDLAQQMIRLAGFRPNVDIEIAFTGLRPGEKLFEELMHGDEIQSESPIPGLTVADPRISDYETIAKAFDQIENRARNRDRPGVIALLQDLVPEYRIDPVGAGMHLNTQSRSQN